MREPHPVGFEVKCKACGAVFARLRIATRDGDPLDAERFEWPDGTPCRDGELMECRACGRRASGINSDGIALTA
jgi:hypothetical protein